MAWREISITDCQEYLQSVCDPDQDPFVAEGEAEKALPSIAQTSRALSSKAALSLEEMEDIHRMCAVLMSSVIHASSMDVALSSASSLLHVVSLNGAASMGCNTFNIWQALHAALLRLVSSAMKSPAEKRKAGVNSSNNNSHTAAEEEESTDEASGAEADEEDAEAELQIQFSQQSSSQSSSSGIARRASQRRTATSSSSSAHAAAAAATSTASKKSRGSSLSKAVFKEFSLALSARVDVLLTIKDEDLLFSFTELMLQFLYLTAVKSELHVGVNGLQLALVKFSSLSGSCLMMAHKALLPLLTMNIGRHAIIPDNQKVRKACHLLTVTLFQEIVKTALPLSLSIEESEHGDDDDALSVAAPTPSKSVEEEQEREKDKEMEEEENEEIEEPEEDDLDESFSSPVKSRRRRRGSKKKAKASKAKARTETSTPSSVASSSSAAAAVSAAQRATLSLAQVCALGVLQRMMLTCPDRAPVRALVGQSVVDLLSSLSALYEENKEREETKDISMKALEIITHFVSFLSKLSRSNKTPFRAFALEAMCALLMLSWFWQSLPDMSSSACLLHALVQRCEDASPSVRMRALSALQDLVASYGAHSSVSMIATMYDLLMGNSVRGSSSPTGTNTGGDKVFKSVLDVVRGLTLDEKTLVRGRALQIYSELLTKTWFKIAAAPSLVPFSVPNTDANAVRSTAALETIEMHIAEDDLSLFASACRDVSLSVRKHALQALSLIVQKRPFNEAAQLHWLQAALPLSLDNESSVSLKLAGVFQDVVLQSIFDWKQTISVENNRKTKTNNNKTSTKANNNKSVKTRRQEDKDNEQCDNIEDNDNKDKERDEERKAWLLLGWRLIFNAHAMGLSQLLRTLFASLVKQQQIVFSKEVSALSFFQIIDSCKLASQSLSHSKTHAENEQEASLFTEAEKESVAHAAWVLLECIVSQSNVRVLDTQTSSGREKRVEDYLQSVGSVTFVVDCYRAKREKSATSSQTPTHTKTCTQTQSLLDEEDLRILRVLEKMAVNLSREDALFMVCEVETQLQTLSLPSELAAVCVQLRFQLSRALAAAAHSEKEEERERALHEDVQRWASSLAIRIYQLLHAFVFQQLPSLPESCEDASPPLIATQFLSKAEIEEEEIVETVQCALFLLGELVMLGFKMEEPELKKTKRKPFFSPRGRMELVATPENKGFRLLLPQCVVDIVQLLMGTTLPRISLSQSQPSSSSQTTKQRGERAESVVEDERECAVRVRAVAFVTLGKLCLRDHLLARDCVNLFLREINSEFQGLSLAENNNDKRAHSASRSRASDSFTARHSSVRSNALLVLGDLCVRHTHLVDRHIDSLACCLQDSDASVRKNALLLLTQLLVQDFVKWKGLLLYRFLMLVVDEDCEIAQFAENILDRTLSAKYPGLLQNHVSEAFLIFNKCSEHPIYSAIALAVAENGESDLSAMCDDDNNSDLGGAVAAGAEQTLLDPATRAFHNTAALSREQRFGVYEFMTKDLSDEMKIQVTAKLVNDVLASAVDNSKRLLPDRSKTTNPSLLGSVSKRKTHNNTPSAHHAASSELTAFETAIEDVFLFLRSPALKIGSKKNATESGVDALDDPNEASQAQNGQSALNAAKTKILKTLSSQHLVSHVLPVVMSLKHCLEATKSPLQGALMEYVLSLVKHHKTEVDQVLQNDPTLKAEVDYDLRQYEKNKKDAQKMAQKVLMSAQKEKSGIMPFGSAVKPTHISPFIQQAVQSSSIKKPLLKGASSAVKMIPGSGMDASEVRASVQKGILRSGNRTAGLGNSTRRVSIVDAYEEDPISRLAATADKAMSKETERMIALGSADRHNVRRLSFADDDENEIEGGSGRRRSWGVVVGQLEADDVDRLVSKDMPGSAHKTMPHKRDAASSSETLPSGKRSRREDASQETNNNSISGVRSAGKRSSLSHSSAGSSSTRPERDSLLALIVSSTKKTERKEEQETQELPAETVAVKKNLEDMFSQVDPSESQQTAPEARPAVARRGKRQTADSLLSLF